MNITDEMIEQAVEVIINTRDFCGNERDAVMDLGNEFDLDRAAAEKLHRIANFRANAKWNQFKKAAGVNPKHIF